MEIVNIVRKYKNGYEFGFPEKVKRGAHGRFVNYVTTRQWLKIIGGFILAIIFTMIGYSIAKGGE